MIVTFKKEVVGLGAKIREARIQSDEQLTQLAAKAGISTPYWNRIERENLKELPEDTLRGIEKALGVDFGVTFPD
ncbi:MAG: helix-turn-helix transcriptional regulator [Symploca sp. SIO1C2]|nr:helix-turn-helix transcriptional regulator [Symploca sp. SIO1C2]NER46974.1 helix-turn-helix transcriptional regulator [Symploca sp. SIO1A3]